VGETDVSCNNQDNDCDGRVDEFFIGQEVSCGGGACAATGIEICRNGNVSDTCYVGEPTPDTNCDGIDQDCDGNIDEAYPSVNTNCGEGVCLRTGNTVCTSGQIQDTCTPGAPVDFDDNCDGFDGDCDGGEDEGYVVSATQCGLGVCQSSGFLSCQSAQIVDSCQVGVPTLQSDNNCNGIDDNCNGQIDEEYLAITTECGEGVCRNTGQLNCTPNGLSDSCTPNLSTGTDLECNGVDEDCDGRFDEHYPIVQMDCGVGICARTGQRECQANANIVNTCQVGLFNEADDDCDQRDDDCDGNLDEHYLITNTECTTENSICSGMGQQICLSTGEFDTCVVNPSPDDLNCDGVDEDCDGNIDEGYMIPDNGVMITCGLGECYNIGAYMCVEGNPIQCTPGAPQDDNNCNGLNDDCDTNEDNDEKIDEGYVGNEETCGDGLCAITQLTICLDGQVQPACVGEDANGDVTQAQQETCNGIDDDCDGNSDESDRYPYNGTEIEIDYTNPSVCSSDHNDCQWNCDANAEGTECIRNNGNACVINCLGANTENLQVCDGLDDDCDKGIDEGVFFNTNTLLNVQVGGIANLETQVGYECRRTDPDYKWMCDGGCRKQEQTFSADCLGLDTESCNNINDDCDSKIDEGLDLGQPLTIPLLLNLVTEVGHECYADDPDYKWSCNGVCRRN
jgi:hypothetical protein